MTVANESALLIVDDEPQVLNALSDLLEDEYPILTYTSPKDALRALKAENTSIAAVLSDQRMPEMAGDAFLAQVRSICPATRIMITGYTDLGGVVRAVNDGGIFAYVAKPWKPHELRSVVSQAVAFFEVSRELSRERALLNNLMDSLPDSVVFKDGQLRYVKINHAEARLINVANPKEAVGKASEDFWPETYAREIEREEREVFETRRALIDKVERIVKADGREMWLSKTKAPIIGEQNVVEGLVCVSRDVTEKLAVEEQLRQAQKMEAIGQLTGGIAHDFNNLLMVIIGNLDALIDKVPSELRDFAESALKASEKGAILTQRLLAYARKQVLHPREVDLNVLVREMEEMLRRTLGAIIEVRLMCGEGVPAVLADREQIESALLNLSINARDAMPNGGRLTIRTERAFAIGPGAQTSSEFALLAVTDTGCGMPAEVLSQVTEPFFTTKDVGKGTGLGLSMVDGFVKQSGGILTIESTVGVGTTVKILLPALLTA